MQHSNNNPMFERVFGDIDEKYFNGLNEIKEMGFSFDDFIGQSPLFTGHVNIARYLAMYESFKQVLDISGHYADVGTWNGAGFLYIAKLIKIFEPYSAFQVHAFDWFKGQGPNQNNKKTNYIGDYDRLIKLLHIQNLQDKAVVHNIDLINELEAFSRDPIYSSIYYKYVYLDCGVKDVLTNTVPFFWDRMVNGGIMLFDHFGSDIVEETEIVMQTLPKGAVIKQYPFTRQPMGYIKKS